MVSLCLRCKGTKALCGRYPCPLAQEPKDIIIHGKEIEGVFTSPFVGSYNYPFVSYGGLVGGGEDIFSLSLEEVSSVLSSTVYSFRKSRDNTLLNKIQDITLSKNRPYIHSLLYKPVSRDVMVDGIILPFSLRAPVKEIEISDSLRTDVIIEKVVNDELKAEDMVHILYRKGKDVYKITELFTIGLLGVNKRLVPTRWGITAVDDILFKKLVVEIKKNKVINDYRVFRSEKFGNVYWIVLFPKYWYFEMIEIYHTEHHYVRGNRPVILKDSENHRGRKRYADEIQGAYYAARLAVAEYLAKKRINAGVLVIREITKDYFFPVGVWQVREGCREALSKKPIVFTDIQELLVYLRANIRFYRYLRSDLVSCRTLMHYFIL